MLGCISIFHLVYAFILKKQGVVRKRFAEHIMDSVVSENGQKQIFQRVCKFFPKYFLLKDFLWMPFYALAL